MLPGTGPDWLSVEVALGAMLGLRLLGARRLVLVTLPLVVALAQIDSRLGDRLPGDLAGQDVLVSAVVCEFPSRRGRVTRFRVQTVQARGQPALPARLEVAWYDASVDPKAGEYWRLLLRLREIRGLQVPGARDREQALILANVGATAYVRSSTLNKRLGKRVWPCPSASARNFVAAGIQRELGDQRATGFIKSLAVAARSDLGVQDWTLLRKTGTTHLMAISGLHIGLVGAFGLCLGRILLWPAAVLGLRVVPTNLAGALALLFATGYSALAGFALPTLRALIMIALAVIFIALRRGLNPWQFLAAAALLIFLGDPLAIFAAGFWLSFFAVAILLMPLMAPNASGSEQGRGWFRRGWLAQLRISLAMAPATLLLFGEVSLIGPVANMLAIPVCAFVVVPMTLLGGLLQIVDAGRAPLALAAWSMEGLIHLLESLSGWSGSSWQPMTRHWLALILAGLSGLALIWPRPRLSWCAPLIFAWPSLIGMSPDPTTSRLRVIVTDVGQGLAVLVQTKRHNLVYDTGPAYQSGGDAAGFVLLPLLRRFGVDRLHRIIVSHDDSDHAGGLTTLLDRYPGAVVYSPKELSGQAPSEPCLAGQSWSWDGVQFAILHPGPRHRLPGISDNDQSCVLLITAGDTKVLLPGDIGRRAERSLLRRLPAGVFDLLIAPHHGSNTSSGPRLVAATTPRYVAFATGYANRWGFPRADVQRRWQDTGACLLSTAEHGSLIFVLQLENTLALRSASRIDGRHFWTAGPVPRACRLLSTPVK